MTTATRQNQSINNSGIHTYLAMKRYRAEATFCYRCCGGSYWLVNGHKLTQEQFDTMFPLELPKHNVKGNRIGSPQQIH